MSVGRPSPLVSIVTVVRDDAHGIARTIESVMGQTYCPIEHIVVDGASTDGTVEIVRRFPGRISTWISEPDHGIAHALNKGVGLATGDLMLFLNSGDYFAGERALADAVE